MQTHGLPDNKKMRAIKMLVHMENKTGTEIYVLYAHSNATTIHKVGADRSHRRTAVCIELAPTMVNREINIQK